MSEIRDALSDEDIHICGRCKEQFVTLESYFKHKRENSCSKLHKTKQSKATTSKSIEAVIASPTWEGISDVALNWPTFDQVLSSSDEATQVLASLFNNTLDPDATNESKFKQHLSQTEQGSFATVEHDKSKQTGTHQNISQVVNAILPTSDSVLYVPNNNNPVSYPIADFSEPTTISATTVEHSFKDQSETNSSRTYTDQHLTTVSTTLCDPGVSNLPAQKSPSGDSNGSDSTAIFSNLTDLDFFHKGDAETEPSLTGSHAQYAQYLGKQLLELTEEATYKKAKDLKFQRRSALKKVMVNSSFCKFCKREFKTRALVVYHEQKIHGRIPSFEVRKEKNYCQVCDQTISGESKSHNSDRHWLRLHCPAEWRRVSDRQVEHLLSTYKDLSTIEIVCKKQFFWCCPICRLSVQDNVQMVAHLENHRVMIDPNTLQPPGPAASATKRRKLNTQSHRPAHVLNRSVGEPHVADMTCIRCPRRFVFWDELEEHAREAHGMESIFVCCLEQCGTVFYSQEELLLHTQIHRQSAFICLSCNSHFGSKRLLMRHKSIKGGSGGCDSDPVSDKGRCKKCGSYFRTSTQLKLHLARDPHNYKCDFCDKVFPSNSKLVEHMASHSSSRPHLCSQCGATFRTPKNLKAHQRIHTQKPQYKCSHCSRAFNRQIILERHVQAVHTSFKPFVCTHPGCGKAFSRRDKLNEHIKRHSPDPSLQCKFCKKSFTVKSNLNLHLKLHIGPMKFFCIHCTEGFSLRWQLRQHLLEKHSVSVTACVVMELTCHLCQTKFKNFSTLQEHRIEQHPDFRDQMSIKQHPQIPAAVPTQPKSNHKLFLVEQHSQAHDHGRTEANPQFPEHEAINTQVQVTPESVSTAQKQTELKSEASDVYEREEVFFACA